MARLTEQGGYVYCAVCTLALLGRVDDGVRDMDALVGWLARRQLPVCAKDDGDDYAGGEEGDGDDGQESREDAFEDAGIEYPREGVGFNGRCNKVVDSCYSWWICATLKALGRLDLVDEGEVLRFLLEQSQHVIGGFGKYPGDVPDIYHSYFGLATMSMLGHADLKVLHTVTCMPVDAIAFLEEVRKSAG
jgi:geranylgeranyl transferase type-1 subunit beta